ncbi:MAG: GNAT family N-acetyltransferase [Candidatus Krumholzibacteriia bacterium]
MARAAPEPAVRWAEMPDLPRLVAFWHRQFGPDSVQAVPGRAEWLFAAQPAGLWTAIAEVADEIVAACGHVVQTVDLPGYGSCEAAFGVDFIVAPEHRRRGLGGRLLDLRLERFPLSLSTGQSGPMAALYRERGAVDLGAFQLARYRRRPGRGGGPKDVVRDLATVLHGLRGRRVRGRRLGLDPDEAAALAARIPGADAARLRWRFAGPVYRDYRIAGLECPHGQALLCTRRQADREIVVDLIGDGPRREALAAAAATTDLAGLDVLCCGNDLGRDLHASGYLVRPYGAHLIGMSRDAKIANELRTGALDVFAASADADLIRRPIA